MLNSKNIRECVLWVNLIYGNMIALKKTKKNHLIITRKRNTRYCKNVKNNKRKKHVNTNNNSKRDGRTTNGDPK